MKETVIIAGALAQKPWHGGHTWVFLQYLLGFRKLGWDVIFVDYLQPDMCFDRAGQPCGVEDSANLEYLVRVMNEFGLHDSYALLTGDRTIGISRSRLKQKAADSTLLLNVMGYLRDDEILGRARRRVFLDIDPGFGQMWQELGLCSMFNGHDRYLTIGENVGQTGCAIPAAGVEWITSRQPVDLDYWKPNEYCANRHFTSIASWRGPYGAVEFRGRTYGLRVHEFRKFVSAPRSSNGAFEIALDIHSADQADRTLLEQNGWKIVEPRTVSSDPWQYRDYLRLSGAEFMVAKNMYVDTRSGWFSDRSACYLASGKPVLAQDTGLQSLYPLGQGLVAFTSLAEAVAGVRDISGNYETHARAARAIAVEYFDSNKVLKALVDKVN